MNDDPEQLGPTAGIVLGPAAGMVEAASLRSQLAAALDNLKSLDQELTRLHAKHNRLLELAINCAFDFADYQDEVETKKE